MHFDQQDPHSLESLKGLSSTLAALGTLQPMRPCRDSKLHSTISSIGLSSRHLTSVVNLGDREATHNVVELQLLRSDASASKLGLDLRTGSAGQKGWSLRLTVEMSTEADVELNLEDGGSSLASGAAVPHARKAGIGSLGRWGCQCSIVLATNEHV